MVSAIVRRGREGGVREGWLGAFTRDAEDSTVYCQPIPLSMILEKWMLTYLKLSPLSLWLFCWLCFVYFRGIVFLREAPGAWCAPPSPFFLTILGAVLRMEPNSLPLHVSSDPYCGERGRRRYLSMPKPFYLTSRLMTRILEFMKLMCMPLIITSPYISSHGNWLPLVCDMWYGEVSRTRRSTSRCTNTQQQHR